MLGMGLKQLLVRIVNGLVVKLKRIKSYSKCARNMSVDLSLVSVEDLLTEVCKRYDHIAITGLKFTNSSYDYVQLRRRVGNRHMIIAQLELFKHFLMKEEFEQSVPIDKDLDK